MMKNQSIKITWITIAKIVDITMYLPWAKHCSNPSHESKQSQLDVTHNSLNPHFIDKNTGGGVV